MTSSPSQSPTSSQETVSSSEARGTKRERSEPPLPGGKLIAQIKEIEALTSRPPLHPDKSARVIPSVLRNAFPTRKGPRVGPEFQAVLPLPLPAPPPPPPGPRPMPPTAPGAPQRKPGEGRQ